MSSRDKILGRIRAALSVAPGPAVMPDAPAVWPSKNLSTAELVGTFAESLAAVGGEMVACHSREEAAQRLETLLKEIDAKRIGIANRKIIAETLSYADGFHDGATVFERFYAPDVAGDASPQAIATLDASVIGAEYLLADTGSAVIASANAFDRMLCYLPPVCCVVAAERMLREHLPGVWPEIFQRIQGDSTGEGALRPATGALRPATGPDTDPNVPIQRHGEFLIVTGPSRTADIEKILIMGVHGPKRLVVFVVNC